MKTHEQYEVGKTVYLNSGSPPMAIVDLFKPTDTPLARVRWQLPDGTFGSDVFPVVCLTDQDPNEVR